MRRFIKYDGNMRPFDFSGKIVLVTGSSRGIGRATAEAFASCGATVVINGREKADVVAAVTDFERKGFSVLKGAADVSKKNEIGSLFASLKESGGIDILVNNAALRPRKKFEEITESEWDDVLAVNLRGAFLASQSAVTHMREKGGGAIVNISSIAATESLSYYTGAHYAASKAGLLGLTRSLAAEFSRENIRVNAVVPGPVGIETLPDDARKFAKGHSSLERPLSLDELIDVVLFLSSDSASGITGENIILGGS